MSVTTLYVPSDAEIAAIEERDLFVQALFHAQDALNDVTRGLLLLSPSHPAFGPFAVARSALVHALSAVDLEYLATAHVATAPACPTCHGARTVYYSGDPADDRDDCPACTVK